MFYLGHRVCGRQVSPRRVLCEVVLKVGVAMVDATFGLPVGGPGREYGDRRH